MDYVSSYDPYAAALEPRDPSETADWVTFWILIVPQLAMAIGVIALHLPPVLLLVLCAPTFLTALLNPFVGIAMLFAILIFDDIITFSGGFTLSKGIGIAVVLGFGLRGKAMGHSFLPVELISRITLGLACLMALSTLWALSPIKTALNSVTALLFAGLVMVGVQLIDKRHKLEIVLTGLMFSSAAAGMMLALNVGGLTGLSGGSAERVVIGESNSNFTGMILTLGALGAVALLFNSNRKFIKMIAPFAIFLMFVGILKGKSRGAIVAIGFSLPAGILMGMRASIGTRIAIIVSSVLGGVVAVFLGGALGFYSLNTIFSRWNTGVSGLTTSRSYIWETGLLLWLDSPQSMLIGNGHAMFSFAYTEEAGQATRLKGHLGRDAHNQWLKTLGELGLVGAIVLAALAIALIIVARRTAPGYALLAWGIIALLLVGSLKGSLDSQKLSWYMLMLCGACGVLFPKQPHHDNDDPLLEEYWRVQQQQYA